MPDVLVQSGLLHGTLPLLLAAAAVSLLLADPLADRLGIPTWHAVALSTCILGFLAITLLPRSVVTGGVDRAVGDTCRLAVTITPTGILANAHQWLNALALVPLGIGVAWLPSPWRGRFTVAAVLLSPFVEVVQAVVPGLDRTCTVDDVVLNVGGLVVGIVLGMAWSARVPARRPSEVREH